MENGEVKTDECLLCGSRLDLDSDHLRHAYLTRKGGLESGYYKPFLGIDEKQIIKSKIGHGEFIICSNRKNCRKRLKSLESDHIK